MPRNSSGTYSLYTPGNPVVTSTVISSTWANNSLADIASALTDSLSRSGDGGMQAPLELTNGAIGAPSLTWASETTSGLYRASAGNFRFSISATDALTLTNAVVTITPPTVIGSATGGAQGPGSLNATGLYDDGVLITNQAGADPSASIGLSAVNGAAATFMRSDAAPALSQAIVPTWTRVHTFTPTGERAINISAAANQYGMLLTGNSTASQSYGLQVAAGTNSGDVCFLLRNQAANRNFMAVFGNSQFEFGNTSDNPAYGFLGTGTTTHGGDIVFTTGGTAYSVGYRQIPRSTTATTFAAADVGKCVAVTAAINIPASVFSAGDAISVYNDSGSAVNITISAGTLRLSGTTTTGTRSLAARGWATLWFNVGGATPEVIAIGDVS